MKRKPLPVCTLLTFINWHFQLSCVRDGIKTLLVKWLMVHLESGANAVRFSGTYFVVEPWKIWTNKLTLTCKDFWRNCRKKLDISLCIAEREKFERWCEENQNKQRGPLLMKQWNAGSDYIFITMSTTSWFLFYFSIFILKKHS